jgi:prefoldin subunit 5
MNNEPTLEECARYLVNRLDEQDRLIFKMGEAINNLDARLMMTERALARLMKAANGEKYDETTQTWWN